MADSVTPPPGAAVRGPAGDPFFGGGEAGVILAAIDWSQKSIGVVENWPQSLRTALGICLASPHPICLIWGRERLYFYNDACAAILGTKHPSALGESYITVWPEIWDGSIRPLLETVENTGQASWCDDLLLVLRRHGYNEECYFSFSFAPTRIEDGSVGGVFAAITETTRQVVAERRLGTLRDLGARTPTATSAEEACAIAGDVLTSTALDVPFGLFYLVSEDGQFARCVERIGLASDTPVAPERVTLNDVSGDVWPFAKVIRSGKPLTCSPLTAQSGPIHAGPWPEPIERAVVLPIGRPGVAEPFGFAVLGVSPRRPLDCDYEAFLETTTRHLTMAVSNARAHIDERRRSQALAADVQRTTAEQLAASAARFEQLVGILPAGVIACDADGSIIYFNSRAAEIWRSKPNPGESYARFAARFRVLSVDGRPLPEAERHLARALHDGISFDNEESQMERPDGTRFIARFNIRPTFEANGAISGAIIVFQDVTSERTAAIALQETQERYRAVFQQASVGIFESDLRGQIVRTNAALSRIMGFSPEELVQMNWRQLVHPDELEADQAMAGRLLRGDVPSVTTERRYRRKDGSIGWIDVFATLIRNTHGLPSYGLAVVVDISERKRAEAELRETEERFRVAADNAPVLIWMTDAHKGGTWFNQPWLEFVGRSLEREVDTGWTMSIHEEDLPRCLEQYSMAFARREAFSTEYRLRRHDGVFRWFFNHGVPRFQGGEFAGYIGSCIDITDRRAAEEAINASRNAERARRQELEVLTQVAPAGIWMAHDPECREITGNAAAHQMLRIPLGHNLSRSGSAAPASGVRIFQNGEEMPNEALAMRVAARTGLPVMNQELEFRFPDAPSTWVYGSATPLLGENGKVRGVICIMVDVTERKRVEAALRLNEEQLRLVTDQTSVMFTRIDRNHRYRFVNRTYSERYHRPPEDFVGRHISEIIGPATYQTALPQLEKALGGETAQFEVYYPGIKRWGDVVYQPERASDNSIVGLVAVVVDITERKRVETALKRARDEALAASRAKDDFLAALSHELRTPLSPVLLLASEAATDQTLPADLRGDFETIRKSVELEARLIDDLLDLTRITRDKLVLETVQLDLNSVVRDALATVAADLAGKQIAVAVKLAPEPVPVWGDSVRLQQVFWNILKNAVKFTPPGGKVEIRSCPAEEAGNVGIEIADTGIGITPPELERVFEAFAQGDHAVSGGSHRFGGLGLGLAISRKVVELHDGKISATSAGRDTGATFRVELPTSQRMEPSCPKSGAGDGVRVTSGRAENERRDDQTNAALPTDSMLLSIQSATQPTRRILLVEDHTPTRTALEHLLLRRKHHVRAAASAVEAREWAGQEAFDLLISDIGLPDGSGYELMREFRERYGMSGISLTGYGMEEDVIRSREAGFIQHLTKPVRMQSLDSALARVHGTDRAT